MINNSSSVSLKRRKAVFNAIAELGFCPNPIARSMRTRTTRTIGFIIPDISNPLFSVIAREAEAVLQDDGYLLNIANTGDNVDREVKLIKAFVERQCDALIVATNNEFDVRVLDSLRASKLPLVALDRDVNLKVDRVMTDHAHGISLATEYLLDMGHERIGLITGSERVCPGRERIRGYREAYLAHGLDIDEGLIRAGRFDEDFGALQLGLLLELARPPTAVIAGGNQILVGVLQALQVYGLEIPNDISVISCDDTALTQVFSPPITVVDRDVAKIGRTTAQILLERLRHKPASYEPTRSVLPTDLRIRKSCAPPR